MSSMRFRARLDTSHHGPPHPFKNAGHPLYDGAVPLCCQQELHTQGGLGVPTRKRPKDCNLTSVEAMQWGLLYLSLGYDRCY
jgi:hypothetical protein